jgi:hypothetical protein
MKVGDVVVPVGDRLLFCGSGRYSHAIVASVKPFVLVSEHGDMLWSATINEWEFQALCQAHPDIVKVAVDRFKADSRRIRTPGKKPCTCTGRCGGADGLGEGWFCVMGNDQPQAPS